MILLKKHLTLALKHDPENGFLKKELSEVKRYVDPSIYISTFYDQERESDLVLKIKTVQLNNLDQAAVLFWPVNDHFRPFGAFHYAPQQQFNLIANENNYNVNIFVYSLGADVFFKKYWTFNFAANLTDGINNSYNLFPFQKKVDFEPAFSFKYSHPSHFFLITGYKDLFIARNFLNIFAFFVRRYQMNALYEYRFKPPLCGVGASSYLALYINPINNTKYEYTLWARLGKKKFGCNWTARYIYDYKKLDRINLDYYSYKRETDNSLILAVSKEWLPHYYFELNYTHLWRTTLDLTNETRAITPEVIAAPQVLPKHSFQANSGNAYFRYLVNTSLNIDFLGGLYKNTDNYNVWLVKGSINWAF
ncbi:MAG: hypothetical protein HZB76_03090 [Chlamydiae bacterium]|nr:hypothetical protein [Chlamydiota bacterium]